MGREARMNQHSLEYQPPPMTEEEQLWAAWDLPLPDGRNWVIGGTVAEAMAWIRDNRMAGSWRAVPQPPIGVHSGNVWFVGTAWRRQDYHTLKNICHAARLDIHEAEFRL